MTTNTVDDARLPDAMVERAAMALQQVNDCSPLTWDELPDYGKDRLRDHARAALTAAGAGGEAEYLIAEDEIYHKSRVEPELWHEFTPCDQHGNPVGTTPPPAPDMAALVEKWRQLGLAGTYGGRADLNVGGVTLRLSYAEACIVDGIIRRVRADLAALQAPRSEDPRVT